MECTTASGGSGSAPQARMAYPHRFQAQSTHPSSATGTLLPAHIITQQEYYAPHPTPPQLQIRAWHLTCQLSWGLHAYACDPAVQRHTIIQSNCLCLPRGTAACTLDDAVTLMATIVCSRGGVGWGWGGWLCTDQQRHITMPPGPPQQGAVLSRPEGKEPPPLHYHVSTCTRTGLLRGDTFGQASCPSCPISMPHWKAGEKRRKGLATADMIIYERPALGSGCGCCARSIANHFCSLLRRNILAATSCTRSLPGGEWCAWLSHGHEKWWPARMARPSASLQVQHRWLAQCNAMPHIRSTVHLLQRRRQWPCGWSATPPKAGLVCRCQSPPAAQTGKPWLAELPSAVQHNCQSTSFCFLGVPTLACTSSTLTALAGCAWSQPLIHHSHSTPASLVSIRRKLLTRIFLRWRLQALLAAASHGTCNHNPGQPR